MMVRGNSTTTLLEDVRAHKVWRAVLRRVVLALAFCSLLALAPHASAATFTVNSSSNTGDSNPGNGTCSTSNGSGGVCTLRAAIMEANALAGTHTINFNIPTSDAGYSTTRLLVVISVPGALPAITSAGLTINATTQPNTNTGSLGVGGTVGVDALSLSTVPIPDIEIVGTSASPVGLDIQANNVTIRGLAIYGFGATANNDASGNIRIGNNITGALIERNILGSTATSFPSTNYTGAALSTGDNIRSAGGDNGIIRNNLIGFSAGKGIQLGGGSNGWLVENNEVRTNGIGNSNLDGIDIENGSGSDTVRGNRFEYNEALGVDMYSASGSNTVINNTITRNGVGPGGNVETAGVRVYGSGSRIERNIINANYGAGVLITSGSTLNVITRNSIFANGTITNKAGTAATGEIGIDLNAIGNNDSVGTSPYVTPNDANDTDGGGNGLLNFPIIASATLTGGNLVLTGFARPTATLEFFIAAADPRGFGEGQTYVATLTEGSAADTDTTTGTYTSPYKGLTVGTDTTTKFKFTIPAPGGVAVGTTLTATATLTGSTSEFSNNLAVVLPPTIDLVKCVYNGPQCVDSISNVLPGTELVYSMTFTNTGGSPASSFIVFDGIPANTEFKVGSMTYDLGTTSLSAPSMQATNVTPLPPDTDPSWNYTPTGTYDPAVKFVRWKFTTGDIPVGRSGSVRFTVRIK